MIKQEEEIHEDTKPYDSFFFTKGGNSYENLIHNESEKKVQQFIDGMVDTGLTVGNNLIPTLGEASWNMNVTQMPQVQHGVPGQMPQVQHGVPGKNQNEVALAGAGCGEKPYYEMINKQQAEHLKKLQEMHEAEIQQMQQAHMQQMMRMQSMNPMMGMQGMMGQPVINFCLILLGNARYARYWPDRNAGNEHPGRGPTTSHEARSRRTKPNGKLPWAEGWLAPS